MAKNTKIIVEGSEINILQNSENDFISLTDIARYRDQERTNYIIQNWMRTCSAIEFCCLWEQMNNPDFKRIEFDAFKNESGSNSLALTPQKWIDATHDGSLSEMTYLCVHVTCNIHAREKDIGKEDMVGFYPWKWEW